LGNEPASRVEALGNFPQAFHLRFYSQKKFGSTHKHQRALSNN
jgi:hypothetical protein